MKRLFAVIMAVAMLFTCAVFVGAGTDEAGDELIFPFRDVPAARWSNPYIAMLYGEGIVGGRSAASFAPADNIKRAEFVKILCGVAGADTDGYTHAFTDVVKGAWYEPYVSWAASEGIVNGIGAGRFAPDALITREDMATMIYRYVKSTLTPDVSDREDGALPGMPIKPINPGEPIITLPVEPKPTPEIMSLSEGALPERNEPVTFSDFADIADYAAEAVSAMQQAGVIGGVANADGTFRFEPKKNATREQAAKMLGELYMIINPTVTLPDPVHPWEDDPDREKYRILTTGSLGGEHWAAYEFFYDEYLGGDALNDAVRDRDLAVEKTYGIDITYIERNDIEDYVRQSVMAGADDYELVSPSLSQAGDLAVEGFLTDMRDYDEYLRLSEDCWDQSTIRELDLQGHLYFATSDLTLTDKQATWVTFVNMGMLAEYPELTRGYEDGIYSMVESGDWTIERMYNMVKTVSRDVDGDGVMTDLDSYGHGGETFSLQALMIGCGARFYDRDENGELRCVLADRATDMLTGYEYASDIVMNEDYSMLSGRMAHFVSDPWLEGFGGMMEDNRLLFNLTGLNRARIYRRIDCELGIIPMPKVSEAQQGYAATMTGYANCVAIPVNVRDKAGSAEILYALTVAAGQTTYPAYLEGCLGETDETAEAILELIFDSRTVDIRDIYMDMNPYDYEGLTESRIQKETTRAEKLLERLLKDMEPIFNRT